MRDQVAVNISSYELSVFQELAGAGSISRAAERLGITQPGLSRIVRRVEDQMGVLLLIRTKHGVKLTKAGQTFVDNSRALIRDLEALRGVVRRQETEIEGTYLIGAHPQVAAVTFPAIYGKLLHENPGLELKMIHDVSRKIVEGVVSYRIDFGIVVDPARHPDLTIVSLYKDPMCFWARDSKAEERGIVIGDLSLKQTEHLLTSVQRKGRLKDARIVHSTDLSVVRELTLAGVGIGILTKSVAGEKLAQLEAWPSLEETVCLVYRRDAQQSRASAHVRNAIADTLKLRS